MPRKKKNLLISYKIANNPKEFTFNNFDEMHAWAIDLTEAAQRLQSDVSSQDLQIGQAFGSHLVRAHQEFASAIERYTTSQGIDFGEFKANDIKNALDEIRQSSPNLSSGNIPIMDGTVGRTIRLASQENTDLALGIGLMHTNVREINQFRLNQVPWKIVKNAILGEHDLSNPEMLASTFEQKASELEFTYENLGHSLENHHTNLTQQVKDLITSAENSYGEAQDKFKQFMTECIRQRKSDTDELTALKQAYETHMALEAPAKYWEAKSSQHAKGFWVALVAFLVLIAVSLMSIWSYGPTFVESVVGDVEGFNLAALAMITIPALFIAWLLKIVANQIASNHHLKQDSALRQTMITTFLALMKDPGTNVGVEERTLILNAIFRPADRHSDDNGPSPGLMELIRQAKP